MFKYPISNIFTMEKGTINSTRNICRFCSSRRMLRTTEEEKRKVLESLNLMYDAYVGEFNLARKEGPISEIENARFNKSLILDTINECKACDKEVDRANRRLLQLK